MRPSECPNFYPVCNGGESLIGWPRMQDTRDLEKVPPISKHLKYLLTCLGTSSTYAGSHTSSCDWTYLFQSASSCKQTNIVFTTRGQGSDVGIRLPISDLEKCHGAPFGPAALGISPKLLGSILLAFNRLI